MSLTEIAKVEGVGIKTTTDLVVNHGDFSGIVTATKFVGDGSDLTSLPAGLGTALSADQTSPLNSIYYVNDVLTFTTNTTISVPNSSSNAYTNYSEVVINDNVNFTVDDDTNFIPDVLSLST